MNKNISSLRRYLLIGAGTMLIILGLVAMLLPVIPSAPFLLLAAACFLKGSERLHQRLMTHKLVGKHIKNYHEHKAIPKGSKIISISLLWLSLFSSSLLILNNIWATVSLFLAGSAVTAYLLSLKTLPAENTEEKPVEQFLEK